MIADLDASQLIRAVDPGYGILWFAAKPRCLRFSSAESAKWLHIR